MTTRTVRFRIPEGYETLGDLLRAIEATNSGTRFVDESVWDKLADKLNKKVNPGNEYSISIHFEANSKTQAEQIEYLGGNNFVEEEILVVAAALYRDRELNDLFGDTFVRCGSFLPEILYSKSDGAVVAVKGPDAYNDWDEPELVVASCGVATSSGN